MSTREEETNYVRTTFLERIAHELRGPVGVIAGALQELETALGDDAAKHAPLLSIAKRGVRRLVRHADRLQQTGQLERGALRLQRANCDIGALLQDTLNEAQGVENRRNVTVDLLPVERPIVCMIDARCMSVAIYELASNAIRHASQRVVARVREDNGNVVISFEDDNRDTVQFGPSRFRSTRELRGLGLSLSIVDDVIAAHGGKLSIEPRDPSGARGGSEVRVSFPRTAAREEREEAELQEARP
jgi:signal transduction histidine kinase